jgi:hypothetical protein
MNSKKACVLVAMLIFPLMLSAQEAELEPEPELDAVGVRNKEIRNLRSAVKAANPGDYIVLHSGKKYVLTQEEIDIANGIFDYNDLSGVKTETLIDGTEVKTISEAHIAYIYPDGQSAHILKATLSFTAYMENHIEKKFFIAQYVDNLGQHHDMQTIHSPRFKVFRASVQFQTLSNGNEDVGMISITAYNHQGENYKMKFCSRPDMIWGNIGGGGYKPTGETRPIQFDIE